MNLEWLKQAVKELPPRPTEIHAEPCEQCPSAHWPPDPESLEIKEMVGAGAPASEFVFRCAWRPEALCKGVCDFLGHVASTSHPNPQKGG